jgi:hypothetical protein
MKNNSWANIPTNFRIFTYNCPGSRYNASRLNLISLLVEGGITDTSERKILSCIALSGAALEEVTMTKKIFALVMVVSVLGVYLAGCGSKTDDSAAPATTATAGTAPAATAGTAPAATAGDTTK